MKKILLCLAVLLLVLGAGVGVYVWREHTLEEEKQQRFYEMRQSASLAQEEGEIGEIPVDFEKLKEENPDIYAFLTIPGTSIDTPVLQKQGDVAYYLSHDWQGNEDAGGAVCSESEYNGKDFSDAHTVLYGNNRSDGMLFGTLESYADENFFETHRTVAVYTPDAIRYYRIFAAYEYDSRHLLASFDFGNPQKLADYVDGVLEQRDLYAQLDRGTDIAEDAQLLTLSTGSSQDSGKTYLVQALLEKTFQR